MSFKDEGGFMNNEQYEISSTTCALIPKFDLSTVIVEEEKSIHILMPIQKIIEYSCAYYGSSFQGRIIGLKYALGSKYKLPIIIEESKELIFFPTLSAENENCIWISLNNIINYQNCGNYTEITFKNNKKIKIEISYRSFENQMLRATKLLLILKSRKNEAKL